MDVSQAHQQAQQQAQQSHTTSMGPPLLSPNGERLGEQQHLEHQPGSSNGHHASQSQPVGAAAAAQQPKVVQTAFIHKLYK